MLMTGRGLPVFFLLACFAALTASAQAIRVGSLEGNSQVFTGSPVTIIDWSRPASASGSVNTASVAWRNADSPCDGIFYVRFFSIPSNSLSNTTMIAERGPFRAVNGINTVALDPPVNVSAGETYICVRRGTGPDSCGQPFGTFTRDPGRVLFTSGDFKGGALTTLSPATNFRLQAEASSAPAVRVSTIPVVGSVPGANGSFFRTSLTLSNPSYAPIECTLLFHPAGRPGLDTDPSFPVEIPVNRTFFANDIIAAMSQSGLGSLDILTTGSPTPIATARVFNDQGAAGTSGLAEDAVPASPNYLSVATVFIPADLANYRLNVGIRTITAADLNVTVYNADGTQAGSLVKTYAANFFEQVSAAQFLGFDPPAGGKIVVSAFQKEFIVYGATTDNHTNDPSVRIGSD
jgi:hypothetical protein